MRVPAGGTIDFDADPDDDTLEMMLTPEDMRLLAQAAEEQQRAAGVGESMPHSPTASTLPSMPSQITSMQSSASLARGALAGIAGALLIVVAIASLSTARPTTGAKPSPPHQTPRLVAAATQTPTPAPTGSPSPAVPEAQPLRFKNPFDRSEIFEFPPGTTLEEARASVADLLKQRAQDRHIRPGLQHRIIGSAPRRAAKQAEIVQSPKRG
jgi:hypothetical protein